MSGGAAPQRDASGLEAYRAIALAYFGASCRLVERVSKAPRMRDSHDFRAMLEGSVVMSRALADFAKEISAPTHALADAESIEAEVMRFRRELEGM